MIVYRNGAESLKQIRFHRLFVIAVYLWKPVDGNTKVALAIYYQTQFQQADKCSLTVFVVAAKETANEPLPDATTISHEKTRQKQNTEGFDKSQLKHAQTAESKGSVGCDRKSRPNTSNWVSARPNTSNRVQAHPKVHPNTFNHV